MSSKTVTVRLPFALLPIIFFTGVCPPGNLLTIYTADSSLSSANEIITPQNYIVQIEQPVREFLNGSGLANDIQFIVLTKGIPHRLSKDPSGGLTGGQSVDSMLAAIDIASPVMVSFNNDQGGIVGNAYVNFYWRSSEPFTHKKYGGYLVTRLDGYTEADAKALVDRAVRSAPSNVRVLLDMDGGRPIGSLDVQPKLLVQPDARVNFDYSLHYDDFNADMALAYQRILGRPGVYATLESTSAFMGSLLPLTCYVSWGSNDSGYDSGVYRSLIFTRRSICETAVSTSARTFLPTTGGQSLVADLISQGAAGVKGYVTEPYLDAIASPSVLLDMYTSGRNLAESFYSASRLLGWKDIVIGDPLCTLNETNSAVTYRVYGR